MKQNIGIITLLSLIFGAALLSLASPSFIENNKASLGLTSRQFESLEFVDSRGRLCGYIKWGEGKMEFKGNGDASAQVFFMANVKPIVDEYIALRCPRS